MSNLINTPLAAAPSQGVAGVSLSAKERSMEQAQQLVLELSNPVLRGNALAELTKKRELFPELAPILWYSFGTIAVLLQELVSVYHILTPPTLSNAQSSRVCNALALLQCVASHPDTRMEFIKAHMTLYLLPFLNTWGKSRAFEFLRLTSLGVIGALVKVDDRATVSFLLSTEIIPICLRSMEMGSDLSKTVATFIMEKILLDDLGLEYICVTADRFFSVDRVLSNMVESIAEQPSPRLLKHIIRCYLRLVENPRARAALRNRLPGFFRDGTFNSYLRKNLTETSLINKSKLRTSFITISIFRPLKFIKEDQTTRAWLHQLITAVDQIPNIQGGTGFDHILVN